MEFIRDKVDYSVPDFFEKFSHSLPKIVVVNQGFYGDTVQDTFDQDQVLRIHTFSRQKRVIARKSSEGKSHSEYFSIPLSYPIPLCVVKHIGKPSREKSLEEIVNGHRLPVNVQFSKERTLAVGSRSISGGQFPQLKLTEVFEEIYMLGNFIIEGVVHLQPEIIPLYLTEMRLVEVIGLKDHDQSKWRNYVEEITDKVNNSVTFDMTYGNKDIAIYNPDVIKPDTIYSHTAPRTYANLSAILPHEGTSSMYDDVYHSSTYENLELSQTDQSHVLEEDTNVYEDIPDPPKSPKKAMKPPLVKPKMAVPVNTPNVNVRSPVLSELDARLQKRAALLDDEQEIPSISPKPLTPKYPMNTPNVNVWSPAMSELDARLQERATLLDDKPKRPLISPKPVKAAFNFGKARVTPPPSTQTSVTTPSVNPGEVTSPPSLPSRVFKATIKPYVYSVLDTPKDVPSRKVQPTTQGPVTEETYENIIITKPADRTEERVQTETVPVSHRSLSVGSSLAEGQPLDISSLKISQLCEWMAALKLSTYIPLFKEEMVDGEMLLNLDENMLQEEFGMRKLESIRLMTFARKGHVPS